MLIFKFTINFNNPLHIHINLREYAYKIQEAEPYTRVTKG
jgi:hypothetical protein